VLRDLEDSIHVQGLAATRVDLLDQVTIAIIDKGGGPPTDHDGNQAVLPFGDASRPASKVWV